MKLAISLLLCVRFKVHITAFIWDRLQQQLSLCAYERCLCIVTAHPFAFSRRANVPFVLLPSEPVHTVHLCITFIISRLF